MFRARERLGVFLFAANDALGKWLVADYSVGEVMLIRSAGAFAILVILARTQGRSLWVSGQWGLQIARILFLKRQYKEALTVLDRVCLVDPEDVQMHYTAMLSARGLGDAARAEREAKLFRRFKADETSQTLTGRRRMISPEDNNERQPIHEHESAVIR